MTQDGTAESRTAAPGEHSGGPVTLINGFTVAEGRDGVFRQLWNETSAYLRSQPGFVSLRLHRAVSPDPPFRWVNVAVWVSEADYRRSHQTDGFLRLVVQPAWREFPSTPALYEVVTAVGE